MEGLKDDSLTKKKMMPKEEVFGTAEGAEKPELKKEKAKQVADIEDEVFGRAEGEAEPELNKKKKKRKHTLDVDVADAASPQEEGDKPKKKKMKQVVIDAPETPPRTSDKPKYPVTPHKKLLM